MATRREIEQAWRAKTDDELLEAAGTLGEYTPEGQDVIRAELTRRGFEDPVEQKGESALEAEVKAEVDDAYTFAENAPDPDPSELYADVYAEGVAKSEERGGGRSGLR